MLASPAGHLNMQFIVRIRFATPSPFPLRTKRSRSEVSAASDAQLASSHQDRAPHDLSSTEGRVPEGFSPVASFPSLEPEGIPGPCTTAAPKAQRDLFADVSNSSAVKPATLSVPDVTRKPRRVVNLGDLVVEGLKQQQQQQAEPAAAVSSGEHLLSTWHLTDTDMNVSFQMTITKLPVDSFWYKVTCYHADEEEDDPQEADLVMGAAARVVLSKKDEEWLTKMVIHYNTSKLAQKL